MARHTQHRYKRRDSCKCSDGYWLRFVEDPEVIYEFEDDKIWMICNHCYTLLGTFYRDLELQKTSARAPLAELQGKQVTATRHIAWVGYSTEPHTLPLSEPEVAIRAEELLAASVRKALVPSVLVEGLAGTNRRVPPGMVWMTDKVLETQPCQVEPRAFSRDLMPKLPREVMLAFHSVARYQMRHERMHGVIRSLWFQDGEIAGTVEGSLRCLTGKYDSGYAPSSDSYGWDEGEPPCLWQETHHQLYLVYDNRLGWAVMVHPSDITIKENTDD